MVLWAIVGIEMIVDIDPLEETNVPETDPILGYAILADEDELALDEFVCSRVFDKVSSCQRTFDLSQ